MRIFTQVVLAFIVLSTSSLAESFTKTYNTIKMWHYNGNEKIIDTVIYGTTNFIYNVNNTPNIMMIWPSGSTETFVNVGHDPAYKLNDGTTCQSTTTYDKNGVKGLIQLSNELDWTKLIRGNSIYVIIFYNTAISDQQQAPSSPIATGSSTINWLGLELAPATEKEKELLPHAPNVVDAILESKAGMRVMSVKSGTKGDLVGISKGDYIITVNGMPVNNTIPEITTNKVSIIYVHNNMRLEAVVDISGT